MARIDPPPFFRIGRNFPSVARHGVAVEKFDCYINEKPFHHSVDVVLISVILKGHGRHFMGDEVYEEAGGTVAITHYEQLHSIVTDACGMEIFNVYLERICSCSVGAQFTIRRWFKRLRRYAIPADSIFKFSLDLTGNPSILPPNSDSVTCASIVLS